MSVLRLSLFLVGFGATSGCVAIMAADTAKDAAVFTTRAAAKGTIAASRVASAPLRGTDDDD